MAQEVMIGVVIVQNTSKGRHKKNCIKSENGTIGGRGSEKLLNFHHLQMMKNMEGWGGVSE